MKPLIFLFLVTVAMAGEITLSFAPVVTFTKKKNHSYKLWAREKMTDPWELQKEWPTNDYSFHVTYDYRLLPAKSSGFYWLQVDDEPLITPKPTANSANTNGPPAIP